MMIQNYDDLGKLYQNVAPPPWSHDHDMGGWLPVHINDWLPRSLQSYGHYLQSSLLTSKITGEAGREGCKLLLHPRGFQPHKELNLWQAALSL